MLVSALFTNFGSCFEHCRG